MEILLILILFSIAGIALFFVFKLLKWLFRKKVRIAFTITVVILLTTALVINKLFFQKMHFIQSKVYTNLYLLKHPDKNIEFVYQAIQQKIKEHVKTENEVGKKLAYTKENGIYFYKYSKSFPFSIFQDAGTAYFIENEEDLGGFVTEELGMYTKYRLAEFYFEYCEPDSHTYYGEINYFHQGKFEKADSLKCLIGK